ncbi:hypothetical protein HDU93_009112 [Gonapodya sp. JEL0774]|nr:hypothetical protein HDU93_009112 [Gonapodya sp. JEL0774]
MLHGPIAVSDQALTDTGLSLDEFRGTVLGMTLVYWRRRVLASPQGFRDTTTEILDAYVASLPGPTELLHLPRAHVSAPSDPPSMAEELLTHLFEPSALLPRTFRAQTSALRRLFIATSHPSISPYIPPLFQDAKLAATLISWDEHCWSWCIIQSRAIGLWYGPTLVPVVDLLNHHHPPSVVCFPKRRKPRHTADNSGRVVEDHDGLAVSFEAIHSVAAGQELVWNYSAHNDDVGWLLGYGFVPADGKSSASGSMDAMLSVEGVNEIEECVDGGNAKARGVKETSALRLDDIQQRVERYRHGLRKIDTLLAESCTGDVRDSLPRALVRGTKTVLERELRALESFHVRKFT